MTREAAHYGVNVSDMTAALAFYRDLLGFRELRQFPMGDVQSDIVGVDDVSGEIAFLNAGPITIELIVYDTPPNENIHGRASPHDVGVTHLCLTVNDIDTEYERLSSEASVINPPRTVGNGAKIMYLRDPDGNIVELMEPLETDMDADIDIDT